MRELLGKGVFNKLLIVGLSFIAVFKIKIKTNCICNCGPPQSVISQDYRVQLPDRMGDSIEIVIDKVLSDNKCSLPEKQDAYHKARDTLKIADRNTIKNTTAIQN